MLAGIPRLARIAGHQVRSSHYRQREQLLTFNILARIGDAAPRKDNHRRRCTEQIRIVNDITNTSFPGTDGSALQRERRSSPNRRPPHRPRPRQPNHRQLA